MRRTIKNGRFCIYNGNEFKVNRDSDGNIIILTKNDKIMDSTFIDKYGSGVYSKKVSLEEIEALDYDTKIRNCGKCTNNCMLTITSFNDGREYISGNRCERGANLPMTSKKLPNLYDYKYGRIFGYKSLSKDDARRGEVGIPRVLNMYENYPFWHTFFTQLGFRVVLSARSSKKIYEKGIESIPSENACYPAKISHGHIENLIERGIPFIFYPSVAYERKEYEDAGNNYNCPVVAYYPEVIKVNVKRLKNDDATFINEYVGIHRHKDFAKKIYSKLVKYFPNLNEKEVKKVQKEQKEEINDIEKQLKTEYPNGKIKKDKELYMNYLRVLRNFNLKLEKIATLLLPDVKLSSYTPKHNAFAI